MRRDDAGSRMTELLVASTLTILVMAMVGTMFVQVTRITKDSNDTQIFNGLASNAANELSAVLRVATMLAKSDGRARPIVSGSRSVLTIYSLSNTSADQSGSGQGHLHPRLRPGRSPKPLRWRRERWLLDLHGCSSTSSRTFGKGILQPTGVRTSSSPTWT